MFKAIAQLMPLSIFRSSALPLTDTETGLAHALALSSQCLPIINWPTGAAYAAPVVAVPRSRKAAGSRTQSPLHMLMNVTHSHVQQQVRDALKASPTFRQDVAHTFSASSPEEVTEWASAHIGHGYFEPMALLCQWAIAEKLVGLTAQYDFDKMEDCYSV